MITGWSLQESGSGSIVKSSSDDEKHEGVAGLVDRSDPEVAGRQSRDQGARRIPEAEQLSRRPCVQPVDAVVADLGLKEGLDGAPSADHHTDELQGVSASHLDRSGDLHCARS